MDKGNFFVFAIEITSLKGLTLWCPESNQNQNGHWHGDARFSWIENEDLPPRYRHCLFLTRSYKDNPIFSCNGTPETCSKT